MKKRELLAAVLDLRQQSTKDKDELIALAKLLGYERRLVMNIPALTISSTTNDTLNAAISGSCVPSWTYEWVRVEDKSE